MNIAVMGIIAVLLGVGYFYNRLVKHRLHTREGWSGIDVQLKLRHDLVPNLVSIVKAYASHESQTLEEVTRLRDQSKEVAAIGAKAKIENTISSDLKKLFALVEAYPDLKADQNFRKLQDSLTDIENNLQFARRYYNGTVRDYNFFIQSFPSNLVAGFFKFQPAEFFEIEYATERSVPDIKFEN